MAQNRRKLVIAVIGAAVIVVAIVVIIVLAVTSRSESDDGAVQPAPTESAAVDIPDAPVERDGEFVDPSVREQGMVPEPITRDPEAYAIAALEAAGTVDTTKIRHPDFIAHLETWFTPRVNWEENYESAEEATAGYQQEMRQSIVFDEDYWRMLKQQNARVTAEVIDIVEERNYTDGDLTVYVADVLLTFTVKADEEGTSETSYEETVRTSVVPYCREDSIPTPNTAQVAGDCKLIRWMEVYEDGL